VPRPLGILTPIGLRNRLRERNLYDAGLSPPRAEDRQQTVAPSAVAERTLDGRGIHPTHPEIGAAIMAKIHVVEWTAALLAHPTTVRWSSSSNRFAREYPPWALQRADGVKAVLDLLARRGRPR
jgi:hypothetical protein